jgi:heme oxygenase (biliverdin-IX-beta and delta-forming)
VIRSALKESTKEFHRSVESKLQSLMRDDLSMATYKAILSRFYGFYFSIESQLKLIAGLDDAGLEIARRYKVPLLIFDLELLGYSTKQIDQLPKCHDLPILGSIPEALGYLYVVEGSTLGGKIIMSHLMKIMPSANIQAMRFFNSYGTDVGAMWTTFLTVLDRHCNEFNDSDVVIDSACQTFILLDRWLYDFN